jgi:ADP-heptose:LPS heptosyltransferase
LLIVRLDAIGDFVLWLDAARALISHYHSLEYSVVLLGNKAWADWATEMAVADEVWGIDCKQFVKNFLYRWQWLSRIRKTGFEIAIQPTCSRVFLLGDSIVRASGAVERIGSVGNTSNMSPMYRSWSDRWYTRLIPAAPIQLMELKRNAEFMRGMGLTDFRARLPTITQALSGQVNWLPSQPYAVLVPTTGWVGKEWPIDHFLNIGRRLVAVGLQNVVVATSADCERVRGLIDGLPGETVDLVGKTNLGELAELLRSATVVLTNDTSAAHIGAVVDAPVVCILGGGHSGRFLPYEIEDNNEERNLPITVAKQMACFGCNWHCIYSRQEDGAVKCIRDISAETVWRAVERVLSR